MSLLENREDVEEWERANAERADLRRQLAERESHIAALRAAARRAELELAGLGDFAAAEQCAAALATPSPDTHLRALMLAAVRQTRATESVADEVIVDAVLAKGGAR